MINKDILKTTSNYFFNIKDILNSFVLSLSKDTNVILYPFAAYLVGAIPSGFLVARLCGVSDIRRHGSGNIGASNVARLLGKKFFLLILLLDALKAYLFVYFMQAMHIDSNVLLFAAWCLIFGNSYSIFLRGDGGKGVATLFGIMCALSPSMALTFAILWVLLLSIIRIPAYASLMTVFLLMIVSFYTGFNVLFFVTATVLVVIRHKSNIKKLLSS